MKTGILQSLSDPLICEIDAGNDIDDQRGNYFGIGISNKQGLTEHMPFDALGMFFAAELVRRELGLFETTVLIADSHAKSNGIDEASIDKTAKTRRELICTAAHNLDMTNTKVVLGTELTREPQYDDVVQRSTLGNRYERMQLTDMEIFRLMKSGIKIGWKSKSMEYDEKRFDGMYKSVFGSGSTFVYTLPGRSIDGTPLPPYLQSGGKPRLLLRPDEDIESAVDGMPRKVTAYFMKITDLYERLVSGLPANTRNNPEILKDRLKEIYSAVFRDL